MGSKRPEVTTEQCVQLYEEGYSIRQISKILNCSYGTAYGRLASSDIKRRPQWATSPKFQEQEINKG